MTLITALVIVLMIAMNAVFAAYEIALASVSVGRLKALADNHRRGAKAALRMKQSMEASLAVVQVGITLVGAVAAATGGAGAEESLAPYFERALGASEGFAEAIALAIIVVPLAAVTIVAGELIPKVFALKNKEWVCLKLSPSMRVFSFVVYPAVWALEGTVRALVSWTERRWQPKIEGHKPEAIEMQELRAVVSLARMSRLLTAQTEKIILGAARLSGAKVSDIMIPTSEIVTLHVGQNLSDALVAAHLDMHTRFPVCAEAGNAQTICGYVNFKDIVATLRMDRNAPSLRSILRPILSLSTDDTIAASLERMIQGHAHIAIVRDGAGRIVGMMTLEDILEELVGEIEDEYDRIPAHVIETGSGWIMGGAVPLEHAGRTVGMPLSAAEGTAGAANLDGWIRARLARPPRGGDVVSEDGVRVLVRKVRRQRVLEAYISRETPREPRDGRPEPSVEELPVEVRR